MWFQTKNWPDQCILSMYYTQRGTQQSFEEGGSAPRSNPLPLNLPFLTEEGTPFVHLPLTNGAPFMYLDMFRALHTFQLL